MKNRKFYKSLLIVCVVYVKTAFYTIYKYQVHFVVTLFVFIRRSRTLRNVDQNKKDFGISSTCTL